MVDKAAAALGESTHNYSWREKTRKRRHLCQHFIGFPKTITEFANRSLSKQISGIFQICYTSRQKKKTDCEHLNKW